MNKILCIGEALIDMICTDKGKPLSDGDNFLKKPGGAPTNVAAAIAALGGRVELAAKVGTDPFGKHMVDVMKEFGVGTQYMLQDANHFTTFAFVSLMENGERDFYFNRGADGQLSEADIETINLDDVAIIHFGSATAFLPGPLQAAYKRLLQKAQAGNIFTSFDPNYRNLLFRNNKQDFIAQSWNFIKSCDFFKVSDEEAMMISGCSSVENAAREFFSNTNAMFAITLGKEGTLLGINRSTVMIPSIPVTPVDTTGAGDAFVGAVLYQLGHLPAGDIKNLPVQQWQQIITDANKAGARTCEYMGAMEAFKHLNNTIFN
ncbi:MAG: carbohydrate kinase [Ferruginibacter sp.]